MIRFFSRSIAVDLVSLLSEAFAMLKPNQREFVLPALFLTAVAFFIGTLAYRILDPFATEQPGDSWQYGGRGQLPESFATAEWLEFGPAACKECHADAYNAWRGSNHDLANRPIRVRSAADLAPFRISPAVYQKDGERFRLHRRAGDFFIEVRNARGEVTDYPIVGLLGVHPLVNFIVALPDGSLQATTLSWDVDRRELFDSFDGEERLEGDYGHWLGQGLNWNANCAWCHTTTFAKNLNPETLQYDSNWFAQGITCRQCHPGSAAHVQAQLAGNKEDKPPTLSIEQTLHNCFSCHSRRGELTANAFQPGDHYGDHFMLSLASQAGLYFPDGQILDEVFAGASFLTSAMGKAGVTCMDCHDPHSLALKLPSQNNALCMQCHQSGARGAQVIDPKAHSFHAIAEGGRCTDCHMPQRVYMARDPRHDHHFPIPDPFLSIELGVPNACSQCHSDQTDEWAAKWVMEWYGEGFHQRRERPRTRARLFAAVHRGEGDGAALLDYLGVEPNDAWRASLIGLLAYVRPSLAVIEQLRSAAADKSFLVRQQAASVLAASNLQDPAIDALLADPIRAVRIATLQAQPQLASTSPQLADEWQCYVHFNADRPQFAFMLARQALTQGDRGKMQIYLDNATRLSANEAEIWLQKAILQTEAGLTDAAHADFIHAISLEPANARLRWTYALFLAEQGNLDGAITAFHEALFLDPDYPRARYNLVVALGHAQRWSEARDELKTGLSRQPDAEDLLSLQQWLLRIGQWRD